MRWMASAGVALALMGACAKPVLGPAASPPPSCAAPRSSATSVAASAPRTAAPTVAAELPTPRGLAESHAPSCDVLVEELLEANVFHGSPPSSMQDEAYRRNPAFARFAEAWDHGAVYLSCRFRVRVNGSEYRHEHTSHRGPDLGELQSTLCSDPAEAQTTARHILQFTNNCQDLQRGEYWGYVLEPIAP